MEFLIHSGDLGHPTADGVTDLRNRAGESGAHFSKSARSGAPLLDFLIRFGDLDHPTARGVTNLRNRAGESGAHFSKSARSGAPLLEFLVCAGDRGIRGAHFSKSARSGAPLWDFWCGPGISSSRNRGRASTRASLGSGWRLRGWRRLRLRSWRPRGVRIRCRKCSAGVFACA